MLRPFGQGNPKPTFHFYGTFTYANPTKTGNGMMLTFCDRTGSFSAFWNEAVPPLNRSIQLYGQFGAPRLGDTRLPTFFIRKWQG
jgi:hypothetical protein